MRTTHLNTLLVGMVLAISPGWSQAEIQWNEPWYVLANGQRMSVETFTSAMAPDDAARALAGLNQDYQRYLVGEGRIMLSGIRSGRHWLAEIQGKPQGSQGYVSALYFDAEQLAADADPATTPAQRLASAGYGLPKQVFEFGESIFVGLLEADPALRNGQSSNADIQLIPSGAAPGLALAVSMPER